MILRLVPAFRGSAAFIAMVGLAGVVAVAVSSHSIASAADDAAAQRTVVRVFTPFPDGSLAPRFRIIRTVRGSCFFGSPAAKRPDAWRCEPFVLDPCFENRARSQPYVFCISTPWTTAVTRIRLTSALPENVRNRNVTPSRRRPWGLELANGERCTFVEGSPLEIGGRFFHYRCGRSGAAAATRLLRTSSTWMTLFLASGSRDPRWVPIRVAWV